MPLDGKAIAQACRVVTDVPDSIVLGLAFLPDDADVENVRMAMRDGECTHREFADFCAGQGLVPDVTDPFSAFRYSAYERGQLLAWLHFPETEAGLQMARKVLHWATASNHVLLAEPAGSALSEDDLPYFWPR